MAPLQSLLSDALQVAMEDGFPRILPPRNPHAISASSKTETTRAVTGEWSFVLSSVVIL